MPEQGNKGKAPQGWLTREGPQEPQLCDQASPPYLQNAFGLHVPFFFFAAICLARWCSPAAACLRPRAGRWSRLSPSSAPGGGPSCTRSGSPPRGAKPLGAGPLHWPRARTPSPGGSSHLPSDGAQEDQTEARQAPHGARSGSGQAAPCPACTPDQAACRVACSSAKTRWQEKAAVGHRGAHGPGARIRPCWVTWGLVLYSSMEDAPTEGWNEDRNGGWLHTATSSCRFVLIRLVTMERLNYGEEDRAVLLKACACYREPP